MRAAISKHFAPCLLAFSMHGKAENGIRDRLRTLR